jgi:hypothetical protein
MASRSALRSIVSVCRQTGHIALFASIDRGAIATMGSTIRKIIAKSYRHEKIRNLRRAQVHNLATPSCCRNVYNAWSTPQLHMLRPR